MAKDFAKRHSAKAPAKPPPRKHIPGGVWYIAGFASGFFVTFLIYLWQSVPADPASAILNSAPTADPAAKPNSDEMQWDFYEIFPKSEVPIVENYTDKNARAKAEDTRAWVLQAGSFRRQEDADKLRAELILMGMDVFIRSVSKDGQTWHRVMVGPMGTQLELTRTRNKLAENSIESISMRMDP